MVRRILALCLLLSLLCLQVVSETIPFEEQTGLHIGKRFISGPLILKGGNQTVVLTNETIIITKLIVNESGVHLEPYPDITSINISPHYTQIDEAVTFSVQLIVSPSQPIKGVELTIGFDPTKLQVINVMEGNLFDPYPTFFVVDEINNNNGFIVLYDLIVGQGNVADVGNFATITFNATSQGQSQLTFDDGGVVNETQYLGCSMENGIVYFVCSWDIVPDGVVNYIDISSLVSHYGQSGVPDWIRDDINDDGIVNYLDMSALIFRYGQNY